MPEIQTQITDTAQQLGVTTKPQYFDTSALKTAKTLKYKKLKY